MRDTDAMIDGMIDGMIDTVTIDTVMIVVMIVTAMIADVMTDTARIATVTTAATTVTTMMVDVIESVIALLLQEAVDMAISLLPTPSALTMTVLTSFYKASALRTTMLLPLLMSNTSLIPSCLSHLPPTPLVPSKAKLL
jgi:hypothetical protein